MALSDREPSSGGTNGGTMGECAHDERGCMLVTTLEDASLINSGLPAAVKTLLDAGRSDRCDLVEICCIDLHFWLVRQRGLSSMVMSCAE